jgi:hypothetical protein
MPCRGANGGRTGAPETRYSAAAMIPEAPFLFSIAGLSASGGATTARPDVRPES